MIRYVVLAFDDENDPGFGNVNDYVPPLAHPADMFLNRIREEHALWSNVGAVDAAELPAERVAGVEWVHPAPIYSRGWLDEIEGQARE